MDCRRPLDPAGGSRGERTLSPQRTRRRQTRASLFAALAGLLIVCTALHGQSGQPSPPHRSQIDALIAAQHWNDVVGILGTRPARSAEQQYDYGVALAHLGRLPEAQAALEAGLHLAPADARFPVELAGIAFTQKRYAAAAALLAPRASSRPW